MLRRTILTLVLVGMLAGCQTQSEDDRPVVKPGDCNPREYESGICGS